MRIDELVMLRERDLVEFFQARLGRGWRRFVAKRAGRSGLLQGFPRRGGSSCFGIVRDVEDVAISLGFRPLVYDGSQAFERKISKKIQSLVDILNRAIFLTPFSYQQILQFTYHKPRLRRIDSDVLPPETFEFVEVEKRITSPVLAKPMEPATLLSLLQAIAAQPDGAPATPPGGLPRPYGPLSPSGAAWSIPRETLAFKRTLAKFVIRAIDRDAHKSVESRMHTLARIQRFIEGLIQRREFSEAG